MKKQSDFDDELRAEYDLQPLLKNAVWGKYAQQYVEDTKSGRKLLLNTPEEEAQINAGLASDPDTYALSDEEFALLRPVGHPVDDTTKERISIRLSRNISAYFQSTGQDWQTRINEVLSEYVAAQ